MGRSRAVYRSADEDLNPGKSKRKKTSSGSENVGAAVSTGGEAANERKAGLYHCNYCNKDLSGFIRFKCAVCVDYDLCVECFSIGAELYPHKSNHPYRVMDNLSFPFITPDWNADEEISLLEAISTYGFGNWQEVADHVGSKTKAECISHYNSAYMNSLCFPLPDLSRVMGKRKDELLAMAKESPVKKEVPSQLEIPPKEELSSSTTTVKHEVSTKEEDTANQSSPSMPGVKKSANRPQAMDSFKLEVAEQQSDRSIREKKPRLAGDQAPSATELYGYNFRRQEFEIEYDNDAEQLLADMEFKDTDTDAERKLKLQVLHIYSKRLDERKRRKDFILERNLLHSDPFEMSLSPEERQLYKRYNVFARFHSKEEHKELLKSIIEERRILIRIQDLQEARTAGCRTAAEANRFIGEKRKKEAEEKARLNQGAPGGVAGKALKSPRGLSKNLPPFGTDTSSKVTGPIIAKSLENWDVSGLLGADLLSETEKHLCNEIRVLPVHYLKMLQTLSTEIEKGQVKQKADAYRLFKVDPRKVDKVYDMLIRKGIVQA